MSGYVLPQSSTYKHLGLNLSSDLSWSGHVHHIGKEANSTLGLIKRNLKLAPSPAKLLAYTSLVRPKIEYASSIWDPYHANLTTILEAVRKRASRS